MSYGLVGDFYDLAAAYAVAIAQCHCFNDGNKRTTFRVMQTVLDTNGAREPAVSEEVMGQKIIALAQGLIDDGALSDWLRDHA